MNVTLAVYDVLGREVSVLVNEHKAPGAYQVRFDASGLAGGVYFYRLHLFAVASGPEGDVPDGITEYTTTKMMNLVR
jgi:hypothetical protein